MCEVRDLKPNGANILVTEENKKEYVHLVCQMKMTGEILVISPMSSRAVIIFSIADTVSGNGLIYIF